MSFKVPFFAKNQLWLKWKKLQKLSDGRVKLLHPEFYGPVLEDCEPLEKEGFIHLDLTKQLLIHLKGPYIVKLSWTGVYSQDTEKVLVSEAWLEDTLVGKTHSLNDTNKVVIDCGGHTTEDHSKGKYKAAYQALLCDPDDSPIVF